MSTRRRRGFTLLEVLIALALVATSLTLGFGSVRQASLTTDRLHDRVLAHWALMNTYHEINAGIRALSGKAETTMEVMLGREFEVVASLEESKDIRIAHIFVTSAGNPDERLDELHFER